MGIQQVLAALKIHGTSNYTKSKWQAAPPSFYLQKHHSSICNFSRNLAAMRQHHHSSCEGPRSISITCHSGFVIRFYRTSLKASYKDVKILAHASTTSVFGTQGPHKTINLQKYNLTASKIRNRNQGKEVQSISKSRRMTTCIPRSLSKPEHIFQPLDPPSRSDKESKMERCLPSFLVPISYLGKLR